MYLGCRAGRSKLRELYSICVEARTAVLDSPADGSQNFNGKTQREGPTQQRPFILGTTKQQTRHPHYIDRREANDSLASAPLRPHCPYICLPAYLPAYLLSFHFIPSTITVRIGYMVPGTAAKQAYTVK
jgi:hypothetical protein